MNTLLLNILKSAFSNNSLDSWRTNALKKEMYLTPFSVECSHLSGYSYGALDYVFSLNYNDYDFKPVTSPCPIPVDEHIFPVVCTSNGLISEAHKKKQEIKALAISDVLNGASKKHNKKKRLFTEFRTKYLGGRRPYYLTGEETPCYFEAVVSLQTSLTE